MVDIIPEPSDFEVATYQDGAGNIALVLTPPASGPENDLNVILTSDISGSMDSAITTNPKAPEGGPVL